MTRIQPGLSDLVPWPPAHSPDAVKEVSALTDVKVGPGVHRQLHQLFPADLMAVAAILKGKPWPPPSAFTISPGSRQACWRCWSQNGALSDILAAGARLL